MHKDDLQQFLEGELNVEQIQNELDENSIEKDFIDSYQQIISENNTKVPDFNAFEKIKLAKTKRISLIKRLLPYAAVILLLISSVWFFQKQRAEKTEIVLTELELKEIQQNTSIALLHFSQELNACLGEFKNAKAMQQPIRELKNLKNTTINRNNPAKNFKIN
jgi:hypothetical protein